MTQHFHYFSPQTPTENRFDVDLGTSAIRLGDIPGWASAAEAGDVASNGVAIDDPTSTAGYQNDGILGLKTFYVTEDACAAVGADGVNGQRLWTGYITDRSYRRGDSVSPSLIVGAERRIDINLTDLNALAAFRVINASNTRLTGTLSKNGTTTVTGSGTQFLSELAVGSTISIPGGGGTDVLYVSAIASDTSLTTTVAAAHTASGQVVLRLDGGRPAETDVQRVQWITSGVPAYFPVHNDAGFLNTSNPVQMDANDYTDQTAADVMADCANASGKNWFVLYWEATGTDCIWYDWSETSTNYTSLLRLSNVLADVDNTTTFAYMPDMLLKRSPSRTYAGIALQYANGRTYRTRTTTANVYAWRDGTAPTSNVKTLTRANAVADRMLVDSASEEDRVTLKVQLPASLATGIKAGQRIQFKGSHLGFNASNISYDSFTWMRVARLSVAQDEMTDKRYTLSMELTPQSSPSVGSCSTSLGSIETAYNYGASAPLVGGITGAPLTIAQAITPSVTSLLFALLIGTSGNTPGCTNMGSVAGYSTIATDPGGPGQRGTWVLVSKAGTAAASSNASATYDTGYIGGDEFFANQIAVPTTATGIVQYVAQGAGGYYTLAASPTPGHMLLGFFFGDGATLTIGPGSWSTLIYYESSGLGGGGNVVLIAARCVQPGEGNLTYLLQAGPANHGFGYIAEVAIT